MTPLRRLALTELPAVQPNRRARLIACIDLLERGLVERHIAVRLCLLSALAGEHTLLIGPPGTAKSELGRRLHTVFHGAKYFERLLTRFSVPEEIFGPLSIKALEEDRYERQTDGFLPNASIAFIDEVFNANSAILNALLTLLNEREFDNGAGRQRCPLISVIGATNEVPEEEVAEAFFDRFLVRTAVGPVSAAGFDSLVRQMPNGDLAPSIADLGLHKDVLADIAADAQLVELPTTVIAVLGELRQHLTEEGIYVSDRRWVKIAWFIRIAAASEGREAAELWDLLFLPWMTAPDAVRQATVAEWLAARLGFREVFSPARLARVVAAFEAQLNAELHANELDYRESGQLKFSNTDLSGSAGGTNQGAAGPHISNARPRCYGETHIAARITQIDELMHRIAGYIDEIASHRNSLTAYSAQSMWLDAELLSQAATVLNGTAAAIENLVDRVRIVRKGFLDLPKLAEDNHDRPEPIAHESLGDT